MSTVIVVEDDVDSRKTLARVLRAEVAAADVSGATLEALGSLLRAHVRLEERELFEDLQRVVPADALDGLG